MTAAFLGRGDVELARRSSRRALSWVIVAFCVGAGIALISALVFLLICRRSA